jgi:hypothetical protein
VSPPGDCELLKGRDHVLLFRNAAPSIPEIPSEYFLTGYSSHLIHLSVDCNLVSRSASLQPTRTTQSCYFFIETRISLKTPSVEGCSSLEPHCGFSFLLALSFFIYTMGIIVPIFQGCG